MAAKWQPAFLHGLALCANDPLWPGLADGRVDLLAIDRDGVGDAHLVEIKRNAAAALACTPRLLTARAPYRWIAFLRGTEDDDSEAALVSQAPLYRRGVAGRIGAIEIVESATTSTVLGTTSSARARRGSDRPTSPFGGPLALLRAEREPPSRMPAGAEK